MVDFNWRKTEKRSHARASKKRERAAPAPPPPPTRPGEPVLICTECERWNYHRKGCSQTAPMVSAKDWVERESRRRNGSPRVRGAATETTAARAASSPAPASSSSSTRSTRSSTPATSQFPSLWDSGAPTPALPRPGVSKRRSSPLCRTCHREPAWGRSPLCFGCLSAAELLVTPKGELADAKAPPRFQLFAARYRFRRVKCGKADCRRCPHAAYAFRVWRVDGRQRETYLGPVAYETGAYEKPRLRETRPAFGASRSG